MNTPTAKDYSEHRIYYNPDKQRYIANIGFQDGSLLIMVAGARVNPETKDIIIGDFQRAILSGPQEDLEAVIESSSGEFGFRSRPEGKITQQDLAKYLAVAKHTGQRIRTAFPFQISDQEWREKYFALWTIASERAPPDEVIAMLQKGEIKVLAEPYTSVDSTEGVEKP